MKLKKIVRSNRKKKWCMSDLEIKKRQLQTAVEREIEQG